MSKASHSETITKLARAWPGPITAATAKATRERELPLTSMTSLVFKRKLPTAGWYLKQLGAQRVRLFSIDRDGMIHYLKFAKNVLTSLRIALMRAVVGQLLKK